MFLKKTFIIALIAGACREPAPARTTTLEVALLGERIFQENCSSCHSFDSEPALSGPSLENARKSRDATFIRESIVEPGRRVVAGYPAMPDSFGHLNEKELDAVVYFVANEVKQ
ncbi:MAG: cytochrome c [Spirochaetales bacterium]|nr:cytochrome c [Spirochaetales bacterium]